MWDALHRQFGRVQARLACNDEVPSLTLLHIRQLLPQLEHALLHQVHVRSHCGHMVQCALQFFVVDGSVQVLLRIAVCKPGFL